MHVPVRIQVYNIAELDLVVDWSMAAKGGPISPFAILNHTTSGAITTSLGSWVTFHTMETYFSYIVEEYISSFLCSITAELKHSRVQILFSNKNTRKKVCIKYLASTHLESSLSPSISIHTLKEIFLLPKT